MRRYSCCYIPLTYVAFVIFIIIYFKLSRKFDFITNIKCINCTTFEHNNFVAEKEIHYLRFLIINSKCRDQVTVIKPSKH